MAYCKVTWLAARVASAAGTSTAKSQRRAVSLDMAQSLTMVALLGWNIGQYLIT